MRHLSPCHCLIDHLTVSLLADTAALLNVRPTSTRLAAANINCPAAPARPLYDPVRRKVPFPQAIPCHPSLPFFLSLYSYFTRSAVSRSRVHAHHQPSAADHSARRLHGCLVIRCAKPRLTLRNKTRRRRSLKKIRRRKEHREHQEVPAALSDLPHRVSPLHHSRPRAIFFSQQQPYLTPYFHPPNTDIRTSTILVAVVSRVFPPLCEIPRIIGTSSLIRSPTSSNCQAHWKSASHRTALHPSPAARLVWPQEKRPFLGTKLLEALTSPVAGSTFENPTTSYSLTSFHSPVRVAESSSSLHWVSAHCAVVVPTCAPLF